MGAPAEAARPAVDPVLRLFLATTAALFALRGYALRSVGFGDSEALYASYALHPQPAYLDHPGLVGTVAALLGEGGAPTPQTAHTATLVIASLVPWMVFSIARTAGVGVRAAATAGLALAVTPEIAIGLFALTPDVLLAPLWLGALGAALTAVRRPPGDVGSSIAWVIAGLLAGACAAAKASGVLLPLALLAALLTPGLRAHARTTWPWAGLALGAIVLVPIVSYEARLGFPMFRHRLVDTQAGAGPSLRNLGALLGGQLAYVSPVLAGVAVVVARNLTRKRFDDPASTVLFFAFAVPAAALVPLMLWSRVAEPHWLAPALLALVIAGALDPPRLPRWVMPAGLGLAFAMVVVVHVWVLAPDSFRFARPQDPRHDIANELFGWDDADRAIRELLESEPATAEVIVVGPHWTICAQVHARLGPRVPVGCATPIRDDFDGWVPRERWRTAEKVLFVTDNRFPNAAATLFPDRVPARRGRATVFRGGRMVRTFELTLYEGAARAMR